MTRALGAYVIAVAIAVLGGSLGMGIFHGQPFLVAVLGDRLGTIWAGPISMLVLLPFAALPAALTAWLVARRSGWSRVMLAAAGAVVWAGAFLVAGVVVLLAGVPDGRLEWSAGSTAFDLVVIAIAGIAFVEWLQPQPVSESPSAR